jgi:HEAT repeat protein
MVKRKSESFDMDDEEGSKRLSLDEVLQELKDGIGDVPSEPLLQGLSDLTERDIEKLEPVFSSLDANTRRILLQMLVDISSENFRLDYDEFGLMALIDKDGEVRRSAVEVLSESESGYVMNRLIRLAQQDKSLDVRAEACRVLGKFVLLGELGDLSEDKFTRVQECVINVLNNEREDLDVRRRALESIANSSHEIVIPSIESAYQSDDARLQISAVIAMGRSADERWEATVMQELVNGRTPEMRYEAARAAGELQIQEAVPHLARLLAEPDREGQEIAIHALGEIGNREAVRALNAALEGAEAAEDDDMIDLIENAQANASLLSGKMMLFDNE